MKDQDIKRLKSEVKQANQTIRENVAVIKESSNGPLEGLVLVDQTVKYTNQIQIERRKLIEENELLKKKIEMLEQQKKDERVEKEKFYEGASWASKQAVSECEKGNERTRQLKQEYINKLKECGKDEFLRQRCSEWLIDQVERISKETRDQNQLLLENALRNKAVSTKIATTTLI